MSKGRTKGGKWLVQLFYRNISGPGLDPKYPHLLDLYITNFEAMSLEFCFVCWHSITTFEHNGVIESRMQQDFPQPTHTTTWIQTSSSFSREINKMNTNNKYFCLYSTVLYSYKVFYVFDLMYSSKPSYKVKLGSLHPCPTDLPCLPSLTWEADFGGPHQRWSLQCGFPSISARRKKLLKFNNKIKLDLKNGPRP